MFKVIRKFKDKDGRIYDVGEDYPNADAKKPPNTRIKALSSTNNRCGHVYIEKIKEVK